MDILPKNGAPSGEPRSRSRFSDPILWLATGSFLGFSPIMPGTVGAIWGIPLSYALHELASPAVEAILIAVLCLAAIPLCTAAAARLNSKDPGAVVIDEILSLPVTYFALDMHSPALVIVGFLLHRVFDITKPPPARQLERLPRGLGIMSDDLVAGVYSNLALRLLILVGLL